MGEPAPLARDGLYVLVAFGSRDKLQMVLIELDGTDFVMLPTELVNAGTPGPVQSWGIGASCGDVIPNDDGSLTRTCCVAVANSNGFVAVGCITTTHTVGD